MKHIKSLAKKLRNLRVSALKREYGTPVVMAHFIQDPFCRQKWHISSGDNPDIEDWAIGVHDPDGRGVARFAFKMDSIVTVELAPSADGQDAKRVPESS